MKTRGFLLASFKDSSIKLSVKLALNLCLYVFDILFVRAVRSVRTDTRVVLKPIAKCFGAKSCLKTITTCLATGHEIFPQGKGLGL